MAATERAIEVEVARVMRRSYRQALSFWAGLGVLFTAAAAVALFVVSEERGRVLAWVGVAMVTGQIYTRVGVRDRVPEWAAVASGFFAAAGMGALPWIATLTESDAQILAVAIMTSTVVVAAAVSHGVPKVMVAWYLGFVVVGWSGLWAAGGDLRIALGAVAPITAASITDGFRQHRQRRHYARLEVLSDRSARTDALTGVANRRALFDEVDAALDADLQGAMAFIDLDGFKQVNDTQGHDAGDRLLADVAARLVDAFGDDACIARLGGDEFAVFLPRDRADTAAELARLLDRSGVTETPASIGVADVNGSRRDPAALLRAADASMYEAKRRGGGRIALAD